MTKHKWVPSTLGHGELMCKHCLMTNREAGIIGSECPGEPEPAKYLAPGGGGGPGFPRIAAMTETITPDMIEKAEWAIRFKLPDSLSNIARELAKAALRAALAVAPTPKGGDVDGLPGDSIILPGTENFHGRLAPGAASVTGGAPALPLVQNEEAKPHQHWSVEVSTSGEQIVCIETNCLSGREPSEADEATIREAAQHLLAFIGAPPALDGRPAPAEGQNPWLNFGHGALVVDTGVADEKPAVFIAPANPPGVVGEKANQDNRRLDQLEPGEVVLTFPTEEQAKAVADALVGTPAPAEGWRLVPVKPTEAMQIAGQLVPHGIGGCPPSWQLIWEAMIAAAPSQETSNG